MTGSGSLVLQSITATQGPVRRHSHWQDKQEGYWYCSQAFAKITSLCYTWIASLHTASFALHECEEPQLLPSHGGTNMAQHTSTKKERKRWCCNSGVFACLKNEDTWSPCVHELFIQGNNTHACMYVSGHARMLARTMFQVVNVSKAFTHYLQIFIPSWKDFSHSRLLKHLSMHYSNSAYTILSFNVLSSRTTGIGA